MVYNQVRQRYDSRACRGIDDPKSGLCMLLCGTKFDEDYNVLFLWFLKWLRSKKLIRKVRSRLKLVKNKRNCIVQHLRDDIAILIKHGHQQTALDRAGQLFKDECELTIYNLLDNFCEFILVNFSYIRKLKDCNNDIKEAVSTLIFASARFGDLHELKKIRELFRDRFGKTFAAIALDLLTGNLVNQQIRDLQRRCSQTVPVEVKFRLVSEIAESLLHSGPLLIDYPAQPPQHPEEEEWSEDETRDGDIVITDTDAKIVNIDIRSKTRNFINNYSVPSSTSPTLPNAVASSICKENGNDIPFVEGRRTSEHVKDKENGVSLIVESLSESSGSSPKEMVYLDDIEEFVSSVRIEGDIQDQRVFMFSPSNSESSERLRKRSISSGKSCMIDSGTATYYGDSSETSNRRKHLKKGSKCKRIEKCSQEHPCYLCKSDGADLLIYQSVESLSPEEREEFIEDGLCCKRALSMPQPERCFKKDDFISSISRTKSSPVQQDGLLTSDPHVHPKLPDYDDLATKFIALKKAYIGTSR